MPIRAQVHAEVHQPVCSVGDMQGEEGSWGRDRWYYDRLSFPTRSEKKECCSSTLGKKT